MSASVFPNPDGITKQMEQFVCQNFLSLDNFEDQLRNFCEPDVDQGSFRDVLFRLFEEIFGKVWIL